MESTLYSGDFDRKIFNTIDTNHDGVITLDELKIFIEK